MVSTLTAVHESTLVASPAASSLACEMRATWEVEGFEEAAVSEAGLPGSWAWTSTIMLYVIHIHGPIQNRIERERQKLTHGLSTVDACYRNQVANACSSRKWTFGIQLEVCRTSFNLKLTRIVFESIKGDGPGKWLMSPTRGFKLKLNAVKVSLEFFHESSKSPVTR